MAAAKTSVKLSEQWQRGVFKCYRKTIGGRPFYFSQDRGQSERRAKALMAAWDHLQATGSGWTDDTIAAALALAGVTGSRSRRAVGAQHVHDAVEDYLADYKGRVSPGRYLRHVSIFNIFMAQQPNIPLRNISWDKLAASVKHFSQRPRTSHGTPMAVATVQTVLKAVLAYYDWCDLTGRWESPRRFERLFRISYRSLKTLLELKREGSGPVVFSRDELVALWRAANSRQQLYLGCSLNIGDTAQGLADLLKIDVRRGPVGMIIDRHRGKTGVHGIYPLWPEVAALVELHRDRDEDEPLLFKSMDGKPLVWFHNTGRVDSIAKTWSNLLERTAGVRRLGFSALRKTGASIVRDLTGSTEVAQLYLSHKGATVADKHYLSRSFDRLADALLQMRAYLSPMFADADQDARGRAA